MRHDGECRLHELQAQSMSPVAQSVVTSQLALAYPSICLKADVRQQSRVHRAFCVRACTVKATTTTLLSATEAVVSRQQLSRSVECTQMNYSSVHARLGRARHPTNPPRLWRASSGRGMMAVSEVACVPGKGLTALCIMYVGRGRQTPISFAVCALSGLKTQEMIAPTGQVLL